MPNSGSRPSPGFPMASLPGTTLWSTGKPPSGSQPSLLPPNVAAGRLAGPPVSQPPPPLASRPSPPGSMPSSMRGPAVPPSGGFPSPGSPSGPTVPPPPGVRASPFASSSPLSSGPVVNILSVPPNEAVSNGMSFASGSMLGGPRFPPVSSTPPPPMGSPPIVSAPAPPQAPPVSSMQSRPPFSAGGPGVPPPFLAGSQGVPPPPGPPSGAQTWSLQPQQVVDFGESGPVRCSRCKGYINPFMKLIDHGTGRRFTCNFCGFAEETPVAISATWVQMVGAGMLMKGLNCAEERWNLLLQRSTWSIGCDKTIMATLKHDGKLRDGSECAFQCALLYTTLYGQRRI
ncbi:protein transport protein SEC24 B-like [Populus nigra]|uniref:protein transport protein SEC24 B-like n=1 Tax=Populus nigra TaxID=3691 RepID=UPI002B269AEB|nr:protein transport protein SEC24 B-like [Populus nigra]